MFAWLAAIAFALALILLLLGHVPSKDVLGFALAGGMLLSLHAAWPFAPWRRS